MGQQQIGHRDIEGKLYDALIAHMNEEVKIQTKLIEGLKWHGIIGGFTLSTILMVLVWFNIQQIDTKVMITKVKGQVYYLNEDIKKHLDKGH